MNFVDLLFILLLLAGLALGFFQGTIKLLIAIVAFYVSIILASLYFGVLGNVYRQRFNSTLYVGQLTAFATILLVSFLLLTIAGLYTFRYARVPPSLDFLDRILGTLLGLMLGALFMGILAIIMKQLFEYRDVAGSVTFPIMQAFQGSVRSSYLVDFFADTILPMIYVTVRPVLPRESEIIFLVQ